jgi:hypothetical protein
VQNAALGLEMNVEIMVYKSTKSQSSLELFFSLYAKLICRGRIRFLFRQTPRQIMLPVLLPSSGLDDPSVTCVASCCLRLSDDLDYGSSPESQELCDWVCGLDTRQLCLLQAIPQEQLRLFLCAQQHVLGHQFVLGDVDQEILLDENFHTAWRCFAQACATAQEAEGHACHGLNGEHDTGVEVSVDQVLHVVAQMLQAGVFVAVELDPDGADGGLRVRFLLRWGGGVLEEHLFAGLAGEVEARAAAESQYSVQGLLAKCLSCSLLSETTLSHGASTHSGSPSSRAYLLANWSSGRVMSSSMTR